MAGNWTNYGIARVGGGTIGAMQSQNVSASVNNAQIADDNGQIIEQRTFGDTITVSSDWVMKTGEQYANTAVAGQTGSRVVTSYTLNQSNNAYKRVSETAVYISGQTLTFGS